MGCCCCRGDKTDGGEPSHAQSSSSGVVGTNGSNAGVMSPGGSTQQQERPPQPSPPPHSGDIELTGPAPGPLYVAKYDYDARTDEDLGFKKGELLYILDDSEGNWWKARSKVNSKEGYVPNNYIAPVKTLEAHE